MNDAAERVGEETTLSYTLNNLKLFVHRVSFFQVFFFVVILLSVLEFFTGGRGGMHSMDDYAYGMWGVVLALIFLSVFFVLRYFPMKTRMEKRSGGILIAFAVALFTEMYGFPLTIFLLSSYLKVDIPLTHDWGHLLGALITRMGLGNGWLIVMLASNFLLIVGLYFVVKGWRQVYNAGGELVIDGVYARLRHPQYTGILLLTIGFLIQWPTLITLIMWPFLVASYYRLARTEEKLAGEKFGLEYLEYKKRVPMFLPSLKKRRGDVNVWVHGKS